nr:hypothetical protein B0A51_11949 [Rachicladosporium sp. CCFEE 5018]
MRAYSRVSHRAQPNLSRALIAPMRRFTQAPALRLKEDANRSPEELDRIKHEQIEKQKQGKGEWHEELASSSESNTAADKEKVHDHDEHIEDLQKETAEQQEKDHPHGKSDH